MNKLVKNRKSIYLLFAFVSIIFFYLAINILYSQTQYNNDLPNAEKFANNIVLSQTDNEVLIEWEGINDNNLIYYVYRSDSPITGKYSLSTSKVVDYIKATNASRKYSVIDRPVLSSTYYYAVVSYIDNVSFYNAKPKVDTLSIIFNGVVNTNNNQYKIDNTTNNSQYKIDDVVTNNKYEDNTNTIIYEYTNVLVTTNVYNITNTYTNIITTTNVVNNTSGVIKSSNTYNNNSSSVSKYRNEYDRAVIQFKAGNYLSAASILEPVSKVNVSRTLYYNINLLLGKCYKNLGRKKNALDVFNRIKTYNAQEVNFWINQVLTDL